MTCNLSITQSFSPVLIKSDDKLRATTIVFLAAAFDLSSLESHNLSFSRFPCASKRDNLCNKCFEGIILTPIFFLLKEVD